VVDRVDVSGATGGPHGACGSDKRGRWRGAMRIYPSDVFFSAASCFISLLISLRRFLAARLSWGPSPRFKAANSCRRTIMRSDSSLMRFSVDLTLHHNGCMSDAVSNPGVGTFVTRTDDRVLNIEC